MADTYRTKGVSLAKGPVGLVGLVLLAYGITALIFGSHGFTQHVPNGAVHGQTWLGLEVNGWSGLLFIAAGLLLLLSAPLHFTAKGISLIVAIALGAIGAIAVVNGHGALGLFAANHLTEIVWAAGAVLLVGLSLLPRVGARTKERYVGPEQRYDERDQQTAPRRAEPDLGTLNRDPQAVRREPVSTIDREPVLARTAPVEHRSVPSNGVGNRSRTATDIPPRPRSAPLNGSSDRGFVNGDPVMNPDASTTTTRPQLSSTTSNNSEEDQHV
jgi:hypothetical protein